MKLRAIILFCSISGALLVAIWHEIHVRRRAETSVVASRHEATDLKAELVRERQRLTTASAGQREVQHEVDVLRTVSVKRPVSGDQSKGATDPKASAAESIARMPWRDIVVERNPALHARLMAVREEEIGSAYGSFFVGEHLNTAQREKLIEAMLAASEREMDLKSAQRAQQLSETDSAIRTLRERSEETLRATERDILGAEGYERLQDFQRAQPMRDLVQSLAAELVFIGEPLTGVQANELTRILAASTPGYRSGGNAEALIPDLFKSKEPVRLPIDAENVLAQARAVLSSAQFARLELQIRRGQTITELANVMRGWNDEKVPGDPIIGFTIIGRK